MVDLCGSNGPSQLSPTDKRIDEEDPSILFNQLGAFALRIQQLQQSWSQRFSTFEHASKWSTICAVAATHDRTNSFSAELNITGNVRVALQFIPPFPVIIINLLSYA